MFYFFFFQYKIIILISEWNLFHYTYSIFSSKLFFKNRNTLKRSPSVIVANFDNRKCLLHFFMKRKRF